MQDADIASFPCMVSPRLLLCMSSESPTTFLLSPRGGESTGLYFPPSMHRESSVQLRGEDGMIGGFFANNELTWRRRSRGLSFVLAFIWRENVLPAALRGDVRCLNESSQSLIMVPVGIAPTLKKPAEIPQNSGSIFRGSSGGRWRDSVCECLINILHSLQN